MYSYAVIDIKVLSVGEFKMLSVIKFIDVWNYSPCVIYNKTQG